jgi:hypothetical protein
MTVVGFATELRDAAGDLDEPRPSSDCSASWLPISICKGLRRWDGSAGHDPRRLALTLVMVPQAARIIDWCEFCLA